MSKYLILVVLFGFMVGVYCGVELSRKKPTEKCFNLIEEGADSGPICF